MKIVAATAQVVAEHAEQITAVLLPAHVRRAPGAAAGVQPGQSGHRRAEPGAGGVGRRLRRPADRPGRAVLRPRPAPDRLQARLAGHPPRAVHDRRPSPAGRGRRGARRRRHRPRSPRPGTRSTGCSPPSSSPRRPGCTSRRRSTRPHRCGRTGWSAGSRRPPTSSRSCWSRPTAVPLPEIAPGQYVSVFVDLPDGRRQPRQYTVSSTAFGHRLQITVRRVRGVNGAPDGMVSSFLHDHRRSSATSLERQRTGRRLRRRSRRTRRCCWPAPAPASPRCCRSSSTSPAPSPSARSSSRTPTAPPRTTRCARPCCTSAGRSTTSPPTPGTRRSNPATRAARQGYMDLSEMPLPDDVQVFTCGPLPFMRHVRASA